MVELLALYGDDERVGRIPFRSIGKGLKKAAKFTPHYWMAKGAVSAAKIARRKVKKLHGDERVGYDELDEPLLSGKKKKFLPGLRKVGKVTKGFTTGVASAFVPKSTLDLLSKIDPTRKKTTVKGAVTALTPKPIVPVEKSQFKIDTKKIAIIGGSALGALVLLKIATTPRR